MEQTYVRPGKEFGTWKADEHPLTIEYSTAVMDAVRAAVMDGLFRIARGGIEVGGVLFGKRKGDSVRILAWRPLASEYSTGPSFVLSEKDRGALQQLIEGAAQDPGLRGMAPVGWYHSHARSEISLSDHDLAIFDLYFPESWQVALVLRPERLKPLRAGFFVREAGGVVRTESSYREFVIEATTRKRDQQDESSAGAETALRDPRRHMWVDWLLFTVAVLLVFAGAAILARPYVFPKPPAPDPVPVMRQRDELAREVQALRNEMELRDQRIRQLEEANTELETRQRPSEKQAGGKRR